MQDIFEVNTDCGIYVLKKMLNADETDYAIYINVLNINMICLIQEQ